MRNRSHNRRGVLNTANPDWNEDRGSFGRGYQNHGYENDRDSFNYGNDGNRGYGSSSGGRYNDSDRDYNERGGHGENQFGRDSGFNRGKYSADRNEGYSSYNDGSSSSGGQGRDYLNYGSERGGNDRSRDDYDRSNKEGRNYNRGGGNFGGGNYGSDYNRNRREHSEDRDWWDRTSDEVSSWFGDEDAERRREMDRRMSGEHRGKGPKGYTRSDDRIKEDINDRLSDDVFVDASSIDVTVEQGEVTLTGTVSTRSEKRRSEDIAEQVSGVKNVENRLRLSTTVASTQKGDWGSSAADSGTSDTQKERSKTKQTY